MTAYSSLRPQNATSHEWTQRRVSAFQSTVNPSHEPTATASSNDADILRSCRDRRRVLSERMWIGVRLIIHGPSVRRRALKERAAVYGPIAHTCRARRG